MKLKQWKVWDVRSGRVGLLPYLQGLIENHIEMVREGRQVLKVIAEPAEVSAGLVISQRPKIFFQLEGRNLVTHPSGETIVNVGEILIIQAKTPHLEKRLYNRSRYAHIYTNLTNQRYVFHAYTRCANPSKKQYNIANSYIDHHKNAFVLQMLNELCENALRNSACFTALSQSLLQSILLQLMLILKQPHIGAGEHPIIHNCKQLIYEHLQDANLSVSLLAEHMQINPDYLSRVFSKYSEQRLVTYISECRVNLAKEILSNLNVSVEEASALSGFTDRGYFTKVFSRIAGMTPTQFRKSVCAVSIEGRSQL